MLFEIPRSSFHFADSFELGFAALLGGLRQLSQSAIATFSRPVSSLCASLAPDCN